MIPWRTVSHDCIHKYQASKCNSVWYCVSQVIYYVGKNATLTSPVAATYILLLTFCTSFLGSDVFDLLNTWDENSALFANVLGSIPIFIRYDAIMTYDHINNGDNTLLYNECWGFSK